MKSIKSLKSALFKARKWRKHRDRASFEPLLQNETLSFKDKGCLPHLLRKFSASYKYSNKHFLWLTLKYTCLPPKRTAIVFSQWQFLNPLVSLMQACTLSSLWKKALELHPPVREEGEDYWLHPLTKWLEKAINPWTEQTFFLLFFFTKTGQNMKRTHLLL